VIENPGGLRKTYVRREDVARLIEESTREK